MSGMKGIAVSQIILLVLGILVLAVVAYLLYSNFVSSGGSINAEQCRAAATRACTACSIAQAPSCSVSFLDAVGRNCAQHGSINGITGTCKTDATGKETCETLPTTATISCVNYVGQGVGTGATPTPTPTQTPTTQPTCDPATEILNSNTGKCEKITTPTTGTCTQAQCAAKNPPGTIVPTGTDAGKCISGGVFVTC